MPQSLLLLAFILYCVLRSLFWFNAFPNPDEAYYWLWGQHPDFSYYDHPPLLAWIQGLFTKIFGQSLWTLRLPNLFSNSVFFYIYFLLVKYLYPNVARRQQGQYFGAITLAILSSPLYFVMMALAWSDHLSIALSLMSAYSILIFLDTYTQDGKGESWRLYVAAIALGFACLAKYNALLMGLGFLAAIATSPKHRSLFRDPRLYVGVAIAIAGFLPVLLWNFGNDFQSFRFYLSRSVDAGTTIVRLTEPLGFLLFSIVMLSPANVWLLFKGWKNARQRSLLPTDSIYRSLAFWTFAIGTGLLTCVSFFSTALYYWNIMAYLLLFPLLPSFLFNGSNSINGNAKRFFFGSQIYGLLFAVLFVINYSLIPIAAIFSPDIDLESRIEFGWDRVDVAIQSTSIQKGSSNPFLVTPDYRSASLLAYQLIDRQVTAISKRVSQFTLWNLKSSDKVGKDAIVISDDWYPLTENLKSKFDRLSEPQTVPVSLFGIWIKNYYITMGNGFKGF
jgi:4-amino-4-deoxy-L-arabinose transferase-like glycosyltransferase